ncbi:MAG: phenylalanine--tRNA ligase subunit beta, partial [Flavobacteriales bacterium]|nr:phenylalanine--tRNA ligase subunit beta [Flavobacteriales bacterium]
MKISYNWLKEYLELDVNPEELAVVLTDCGLEVEGLEEFESVKGSLEGLIVGEVQRVEKHSNADKLIVTTVNVGNGDLLPIVCGAPNVEAGQKVIVAPPGATLFPVKGEPFRIKETKIRGEISQGMICAEDEIGLGTEHDGIMVLDAGAEIGTEAKRYFDISMDTIFDIGLTPNRIDAASHLGVARDLVAVFELKDQIIDLKRPSVESFHVDNHDLAIEVEVEDKAACPRYSGLTITGIKVDSSPKWLQNKLSSIGLSPINNIV